MLPLRMYNAKEPARSHLRIFIPTGLLQTSRSHIELCTVQRHCSLTPCLDSTTVVVHQCSQRRPTDVFCSEHHKAFNGPCAHQYALSHCCVSSIQDLGLHLRAQVQDCSTCHLVQYDPAALALWHHVAIDTSSALTATLKLINEGQPTANYADRPYHKDDGTFELTSSTTRSSASMFFCNRGGEQI